MVHQTRDNISVKTWLKLDLERLKIYEEFNDKKHVVHAMNKSLFDLLPLLRSERFKYVFMHRFMWRDEVDYLLEVMNNNSTAICSAVPDTFINHAMYFSANLVVGREILKNIGIIEQGGFSQFWRRYVAQLKISRWRRQLRGRLRLSSTEFILLKELISLFIVSGTVMLLGVLVLFVEIVTIRMGYSRVIVLWVN